MKRNLLKYLLLLIIPVIIPINLELNNKTQFDYDPPYVYLFNSLNLASQYGNVGYFDHPGTPVIMASAVIIKFTHLFRNTKDDLQTDVLKNPQYYVLVIAWVFSIINCILIFLLGIFILKITREIAYSLLFQSIPYYSKIIFIWSFQNLSPEPMLLGAVMVFYLFFMWKFYFNKSFGTFKFKYKSKTENEYIELDKSILIFGILIGFCFAVKINTLPLIILPLWFIPKIKNKIIFLGIAFFSFVLFTLPVARYYYDFSYWLMNISLHSGIYGSGAMNVVDMNSFFENFIQSIKSDPILFSVIFITLTIIFIQIIRKKYDKHLKIMMAVFLVQLIDILMVLKHYNEHYFIPIIPSIAISLFIILAMFNLSRLHKFMVILPFIALCFTLNMNLTKNTSAIYQPINQEDCINIYSFGYNSQIYALKFGDDFSLNKNSDILEKIHGKQYFYNIWDKSLTGWKDTISLASLEKQNKKIYFYAFDGYLKEYPTPFKLKLISEGKYLIEP